MVSRGQLWWADLAEPIGSKPAYKRLVLIVQADVFNKSKVNTVIGVAVTSNLRIAEAPGNVLLGKSKSGLKKDSVINVSQVITLDKDMLIETIGKLSKLTMLQVDEGLRLVLSI